MSWYHEEFWRLENENMCHLSQHESLAGNINESHTWGSESAALWSPPPEKILERWLGCCGEIDLPSTTQCYLHNQKPARQVSKKFAKTFGVLTYNFQIYWVCVAVIELTLVWVTWNHSLPLALLMQIVQCLVWKTKKLEILPEKCSTAIFFCLGGILDIQQHFTSNCISTQPFCSIETSCTFTNVWINVMQTAHNKTQLSMRILCCAFTQN